MTGPHFIYIYVNQKHQILADINSFKKKKKTYLSHAATIFTHATENTPYSED